MENFDGDDNDDVVENKEVRKFASKYEMAREDDPRRCQGIKNTGQCPYLAIEDSKYCLMHGGNKAQEAAKKKRLHDYLLFEYNERLDEFASSSNIKNLHGEIGVLRMTLEKILNQIKQPNHFPLFSDKIGNLADKIHKLVMDMQRIDEKTGQMLSKDLVFVIADAIIEIIGKYITDADDVETISREISDAIIAIGSGSTVQKRSD